MQWLICIVNSTEFVATIYVRKKQVVTDVLHPGKTTVPKTEVWGKLAQICKITPEIISVFGLKSYFDDGKTIDFRVIYDSVDYVEKNEPKHRPARHDFYEKKKTSRKQQKELKDNEEDQTAKARVGAGKMQKKQSF